MNSLQLRAQATQKTRLRKGSAFTVVGVVSPKNGLTHALTNITGDWEATDQEPDVYIPEKLERVLRSDKRFIVVIGGRGSGKSVGVADICLIDAKDSQAKTFCLREFQSSIEDSVHSLLKEEIERLEFDGFDTPKRSISCGDNEVFKFAGIARNVNSIKSAHGFSRFSVEEAQFLTQESLDVLTPTARNKPNKGLPSVELEKIDTSGVSILFVANPGSAEDAFSKRFILPFQDELDSNGIYEDDLHLIVVMNFDDNPWYMESGLEQERLWAFKNLPRSLYDHIWLGKYNDSVDNSIIIAEWFDACIDAHKKLGFKPTGAKIASHDASDEGGDSKGYAMRHGSVFLGIQEQTEMNVNEGGHWACGEAIKQNVDFFAWDADGMGAALAEQVSKDFNGKHTKLSAFKGSETPDNPDSIYSPALKSPVEGQMKVRDAVANKRAQYYAELRDRCYRTYRAVVHKEYHDPDTLISFDSSIDLLPKLRAELCRMPIKPNGNGKIELYTKSVMKTKFNFKSPNLGDSVMMAMRFVQLNKPQAVIPKPIGVMGKR